jgi:TonB-dependent Receptor Plug Domain
MKTVKSLAFLLFTSLIIASCASSNQSNTSSSNQPNLNPNMTRSGSGRDYSSYTSLADILRQQVGVTVTASGNIQIRGVNSITVDTRPLYVYDGIELGRSYQKANQAINLADIKSIRIIRDLNQLTTYGERGRNGVIYIKSRK